MASINSVHSADTTTLRCLCLAVSLENGITPTPAESNGSNFVRARYHADGVDEAINEWSSDTLTMLRKPRAEGCRDDGGILCFVGYAEGFLDFEGGLDVLEEGDGEGVALVEVGDIAYVDVSIDCYIRP